MSAKEDIIKDLKLLITEAGHYDSVRAAGVIVAYAIITASRTIADAIKVAAGRNG